MTMKINNIVQAGLFILMNGIFSLTCCKESLQDVVFLSGLYEKIYADYVRKFYFLRGVEGILSVRPIHHLFHLFTGSSLSQRDYFFLESFLCKRLG